MVSDMEASRSVTYDYCFLPFVARSAFNLEEEFTSNEKVFVFLDDFSFFQFVTKVYRKFNLLLLLNKYSILYDTADLTRSTGPLAAGQPHLTLNTLAP